MNTYSLRVLILTLLIPISLALAVASTHAHEISPGYVDSGRATASLSPDGSLVAVASNNSVKVWRTATGTMLRNFNIGPLYTPDQNFMRTIVAFSPNNKMLVAATHYVWGSSKADWSEVVPDLLSEGQLQGWDFEQGRLLWQVKENSFYLTAFSPDSKFLAVSSSGPFALREARTGKMLRAFAYRSSGLDKILFSPDGKLVYATAENIDAGLWDTKTGRLLKTKKDADVYLSKFVKETKYALKLTDNSLELYDTQTGELKRAIEID